VEDDRGALTGDARVILVIEDDPEFAHVLRDLVREHGFQCLVSETADSGVAMARQYLPHAIVLDIGLPDYSGLSVLDRLKHNVQTRHIPIHIVSGHDYSRTALAQGAVGYMLKPAKREKLAETLGEIEQRLDRKVRRVLVVEDDPTQLDAVRRLLTADGVETVGVTTGAACLAQLAAVTFDCMVLDLSLPDMSGFDLLDRLGADGLRAFPPVIVYTGKDLAPADELRLRRYSRSIIIKGAKSPERLLDEVTLFLHQVVSDLPTEQQRVLARALGRDAVIEKRRILVAEDDVRNVFALTSIFEPHGANMVIARNGREAIEALELAEANGEPIDLVLMDIMMPEMDGHAAMREIRRRPGWKDLPIIALTAKAMPDDHVQCLAAGANDYMSKPLDVEKLLSLVRVWMPR
jgi:CheY-like chemotaxis protein